ncbi:UNVERIFIED_CONTAM: hypothetical protein Sradi_4388600 [Sesamum radiatum]|uniref:Retrotransposon Copia-like N-terminal domain-containing protein n=1 Tax=Sesamum radiatum TaxID=300843 RepID=A0AAW2NQQ6_SESRA
MASSSGTVSNTPTAGNLRMQDDPGMIMILGPLNGNNWLSWSRSVQIALEGRDKLRFVDGTLIQPDEGSIELKQWRITYSMELSDQRRKIGNGGKAYMTTEESGSSTGYPMDLPANTGGNLVTVADLTEALELIQNRAPPDPVRVHFAQGDEMTGTTLVNTLSRDRVGSWIVDTGATKITCVVMHNYFVP